MRYKVKHAKVKNTGLLFEMLLRQVTVDVLNNKSNITALNMIKNYFNDKKELGKELRLYNALMQEKFSSDKKAEFLISEVIKNRKLINSSKLRREKYNLIKEMNKFYNVNEMLSSKVNEYKTYASIYKLFEYDNKLSPNEKTETYFNLIEHITSDDKNIKLSEISKRKNNSDKDIRILSYRILLEKFNKKYGRLNGNQRELLRVYINNVSNTNSLKEYVNKKVPIIKNKIKKASNKVTDKVLKIKLAEAINSMNKFCDINSKSKIVKDSVIVQMMRYMELASELNKYGKK